MNDEAREPLDRADAHPRALELLTDAFFWNDGDDGNPLGPGTGAETLAAFREWRADHPNESALALLKELLVRWEARDGGWDLVTGVEVEEAGAEDEFSLLLRDEVILAIAFAQLFEEGRVEPEIQRRAVLATVREALPMLLAPWGDRTLERATRLERMGKVLARAPR